VHEIELSLQFEIRSHPNMMVLQGALLQMWSKDPLLDSSVDLSSPLFYFDRLRMRKPGDRQFKLPPHLDSGSLTRWSDPIYRWAA